MTYQLLMNCLIVSVVFNIVLLTHDLKKEIMPCTAYEESMCFIIPPLIIGIFVFGLGHLLTIFQNIF